MLPAFGAGGGKGAGEEGLAGAGRAGGREGEGGREGGREGECCPPLLQVEARERARGFCRCREGWREEGREGGRKGGREEGGRKAGGMEREERGR